MASKKTITADELAGNTDVFGDLMNTGVSKKSTPPAEKFVEERQEKPVHLTMLVKESTRKAWKQFFIEHDLNTTQGIEIAMAHLMNDVMTNKYRLNKGGLVEIRNSDD
ncbi:MAG: hypothetical protein K5866_06375 [Treponema sp.]|nr:hypothetical protein [Treponema sp.]